MARNSYPRNIAAGQWFFGVMIDPWKIEEAGEWRVESAEWRMENGKSTTKVQDTVTHVVGVMEASYLARRVLLLLSGGVSASCS
jgi:hypothetical protein